MSDIQTSIVSVVGRNTRNGNVVYDVTLGDGVAYSTFDPALAQQCAALQGQQVVARTEVTQKAGNNGRVYTNKNLLAVAAGGQALPAAPVQAPVQQLAAPAAGIPMAAPTGGGGGGGSMSPETVARITRLSAVASASTIVAELYSGAGDGVGIGEILGKTLQLSEALVKYAYEGTGGAGQVVAPAQAIIVNDGTPQGVAQAVNAVAESAVVQVGAPVGPTNDIPWE